MATEYYSDRNEQRPQGAPAGFRGRNDDRLLAGSGNAIPETMSTEQLGTRQLGELTGMCVTYVIESGPLNQQHLWEFKPARNDNVWNCCPHGGVYKC